MPTRCTTVRNPDPNTPRPPDMFHSIHIPLIALALPVLVIAGLAILVSMHARNAQIWQATAQTVSARAYQKGRDDEAKSRTLPLDERISDAYTRGVRDCHREWTKVMEQKGLKIALSQPGEFEDFEKGGAGHHG